MAFTRHGLILMMYLERTEMSHALCICIYYDLFEVIRGQTLVETVKLGPDRAHYAKYIQNTCVSTHNHVKNLNERLFEVKSGHRKSLEVKLQSK